MNLADPISTPKAYERWLKALIVLTVLCAIGTIISVIFLVQGKGDLIITAIFLMSTCMFFFAHKEKAAGPRPGSPEYQALERQQEARAEAAKNRRYRKQHPHAVARELVKNNKVEGRISYKDEQKNA